LPHHTPSSQPLLLHDLLLLFCVNPSPHSPHLSSSRSFTHSPTLRLRRF
jgi:hypothetical protein